VAWAAALRGPDRVVPRVVPDLARGARLARAAGLDFEAREAGLAAARVERERAPPLALERDEADERFWPEPPEERPPDDFGCGIFDLPLRGWRSRLLAD
jgi:hypothetical protein